MRSQLATAHSGLDVVGEEGVEEEDAKEDVENDGEED